MIKKSDKGYALAYTVVVMTVVFALCALLASLVISYGFVARFEEKIHDRREYFDRIGYVYYGVDGDIDAFTAALLSESRFGFKDDASSGASVTDGKTVYRLTTASDTTLRTMTLSSSGSIAFRVSLQTNGDIWIIAEWLVP